MAGDVLPGAGGLGKVRYKREGVGKSGGARVIYFTRLAQGQPAKGGKLLGRLAAPPGVNPFLRHAPGEVVACAVVLF